MNRPSTHPLRSSLRIPRNCTSAIATALYANHGTCQREQRIENHRSEKSKQRIHPHLHGGIGNDCDERSAHAEVAAQSLRQVRVKSALH